MSVIDICLLIFTLSFAVPYIVARLVKTFRGKQFEPGEMEFNLKIIDFIKIMIGVLVGRLIGQ